MSSSYFEQLQAPELEDPSVHFTRRSEEVDMTEAVNSQIDKRGEDTDRYFDRMISMYNHMHEQKSKQWTDIQTLMGRVVPTVKSWKEYQKGLEPYRELEKRKKHLLSIGLDPNDPANFRLLSPEIAQNLEQEQEDKIADEAIFDASYAELNSPNPNVDKVNVLMTGDINNTGQGFYETERFAYKDADFLKQKFLHYWEKAANTMQVKIPQPDGTFIFKTYYQASQAEKQLISQVIAFHYLTTHREGFEGNQGKYDELVSLPIMGQIDSILEKDNANAVKITRDNAEKTAAIDLRLRLQNPNYFIDHINKHKGAFGGDLKATRMHVAQEVARLAKTGEVTRADVNGILDHEFLGRDGKYHKVRDYWKEEADIMLGGVNTYAKEALETRKTLEDGKKDSLELEYLAEMDKRETPLTLNERQQLVIKFASELGIPVEDVPDSIKNVYTASEIPDAEIDWQLKQKEANGQSISLADIRGIKNHELRKQWRGKITDGMDEDARDDFITAAVNEKTQERDLNQAKTIKYRAYEQNAKRAYNRAYVLAKSRGATNEEADAAGRKVVTDGLDLGGDDDTSWSNYGSVPQSLESMNNIGRAKAALVRDSSLINSEQPWSGEEVAIKQALLSKGTEVPTYYRNFPHIKKLPNSKPATPTNLMLYRLDKLGLLKEGKVKLPEDKLPLYLQDLLRKPNSSKTLRVIYDENYNKELMPNEEIQNLMHQRLRSNAQTSQQYALLDSSYRVLVNIPEELNNEFVAQVGDLPPYLQLNNLQPEVAKAFVADVLMT